MRVAIYGRYSSENQSEKSIDDQIRVCRNYVKEHGMECEEKHVYVDEAVSGSIVNRPGLLALEAAMENREFAAVVVDDLSRLSRSNHQMLTLVMKFNYHQVKIISVSDNITTDDDNAKLGIHVRGFINELYLDDLRKKTMRGLEGQKLRGYSTGEKVYGYRSEPVGELKLNKKGQPKHEGMVHKIEPEEADVVRRIFREFISGRSICKIVKDLNTEKIPTKKGLSGGWNVSTVSRILKNEKYAGNWTWRKSKCVRDPLTGKARQVSRPEDERIPVFREDLVIIDEDTWSRAERRWEEIDGARPVKRGFQKKTKQRSYVHASPPHLFAGLMRCACCKGSILLVSGKGGGYYGCYNATRKTCDNNLLVPRKKLEQVILEELKKKILTPENVEYVYKNVEKIAAQGLNEVPELLRRKKAQVEKVAMEIRNYLDFIKVGNLSRAVSEALKDAEAREGDLRQEISSMEFQKEKTFKAPPREWIDYRLERLYETLTRNTSAAAIALKELLGTIELEPVADGEYFELLNDGEKRFKPYYVAHTEVQTLCLMDGEDDSSNWLQWRRVRDLNPHVLADGGFQIRCLAN